MSPDKHRGRPATETASGKSIATDTSSLSPSGLEQAIENAAADWWSIGAQVALAQLARSGRGFVASHLIDLVGEPTDSHYVGAAFAAAQRRGVIECCGARIDRTGRPSRVWFGVPDAS